MGNSLISKRACLALTIAFTLAFISGCSSGNSLSQDLKDHLMSELRDEFDLYPVSLYEDVEEVDAPHKTGEANHFKVSVRFGDSKDVPFEIWADNAKPSYDEMHYKCLLGDSELRRIVEDFKYGAKANAPLGNTKWDGVWKFGDSWTIKLNSNTDGGDYAVIGVDKTSVLYMRKDGHLYTGDNKGNISVDFGFSLKKQ